MYHRDVVDDLPFQIDHRIVGSLLRRRAECRLICTLLMKELQRILAQDKATCVCVFGSIARGDADPHSSDVDLMFLNCDEERRNVILEEILSSNRCLNFEDALDLLLEKSDDANRRLGLRFPCITPELLIQPGNEALRRRIQLMLEAVPLVNPEIHASIVDLLVGFYNLEPQERVHQTPQAIIADLDQYGGAMLEETAARANKGSDYYAKYISLRRFNEQIVRLGLVEAVFSKRRVLSSPNPRLEFAAILKKPAMDKLLFWSSPEFLAGRVMSILVKLHGVDLLDGLRRAVAGDPHLSTLAQRAQSVDSLLIDAAQDVIKQHNNTLDLLHSQVMRRHLVAAPTNVVNWQTDPQLTHLVTQTDRCLKALSSLALMIESIFLLADKHRVFERPYERSGLEAAVDYLVAGFER